MVWNTPIQATTNQVVTAAFWNAQIYDNFNAAYPDGVEWDTWADSIHAGITPGSASPNARFGRLGEWVAIEWNIVFAADSAMSADPQINLPEPVNPNYSGSVVVNPPCGWGMVRDASAALEFFVYVELLASLDRVRIRLVDAAATFLRPSTTSIQATQPFTWATNDSLSFTALYETD